MILVGQYDSPYVRRVGISMHLFGLTFERNTLSVFADAAEMRTINPLGRIPSLILDDGETLIDSAAILDHLDELAGPERALLPARGAARRQALRIVALATGTLDKTGAIVYERTLRPAAAQFEPWLERCAIQVAGGLAHLEQMTAAAAGGWYLGDRLMQPDIMVGCLLAYFRLRAQDLFSVERYPALAALLTRFDALPEAMRTAPAADEVMPSGGLAPG